MKNLQRISISVVLLLILISFKGFAQNPDWIWAKGFGGKGNDESYCVAMDKLGYIYFAGSFEDSITFDNIKIKVQNANYLTKGNDLFIVKCDLNGNIVWAKSAGGYYSSLQKILSIVTDDIGNIYITGHGSPEFTFGALSEGKGSLFVAKYDSDGKILWNYSTGGGLFIDEGRSVAVDRQGNLYVTGSFRHAVFGSEPLKTAGADEIFIIKYRSDGQLLWAKSYGGRLNDVGYSLTIDNDGDFYLTGAFGSDTVRMGSYTLVNSGTITNGGGSTSDYFIAKFDSNGNVIWASSAGGAHAFDRGHGITTDNNGNVYATGFFRSPIITFGSTKLYNNTINRDDMFIVKYSPEGTALWAKSAGGNGYDFGNTVVTDALGNIYLSGMSGSQSITLETFTLNPGSFIVKYNPNGNVSWAKSVGGSGGGQKDFGQNIVMDFTDNHIYLTGHFFTSSLILGSHLLSNSNSDTIQKTSDVFIAKLNTIATSISEAIPNNEPLISPNPTTGGLHISLPAPGIWTITIYTLDGQSIFKKEISESNAMIDLSGKAKGAYVYRLLKDGAVFKTGKLVLE